MVRNGWERPPGRSGPDHMLRCRLLAVLTAAVVIVAALAPAAASDPTRGFTVYNGSERPMVVARSQGDFSGGSHPVGSVLEPHHAQRWELTYAPLGDDGTVTYTAPNRKGPQDPAFEAHMRINFFGATFAYCVADYHQTCVPPPDRDPAFRFPAGDTITFLGVIEEGTERAIPLPEPPPRSVNRGGPRPTPRPGVHRPKTDRSSRARTRRRPPSARQRRPRPIPRARTDRLTGALPLSLAATAFRRRRERRRGLLFCARRTGKAGAGGLVTGSTTEQNSD